MHQLEELKLDFYMEQVKPQEGQLQLQQAPCKNPRTVLQKIREEEVILVFLVVQEVLIMD